MLLSPYANSSAPTLAFKNSFNFPLFFLEFHHYKKLTRFIVAPDEIHSPNCANLAYFNLLNYLIQDNYLQNWALTIKISIT